jgi:hypothetical protein
MLMNAFVLYKLHDDANNKKLPQSYSSLDFISDWIQDLEKDDDAASSDISASDAASEESVAVPDYKEHRRNWWQAAPGTAIRMDSRFHGLQHAGNCYFTNVDKNGENKRADLRRLCMWCGERTVYFCEDCNVPLCIGICNKNFHTKRKLPSLRRNK